MARRAALGVVIGAALGLFNALIIELFHLSSIVATLAAMAMCGGATVAVSNGTQVMGAGEASSFSRFVLSRPPGIPVGPYGSPPS